MSGCVNTSVFNGNLEGVDPIRVERQVFLDLRYRGVRRFVGPAGVDRTLADSSAKDGSAESE
jgi:hypothetical protein